MAPAASPAAILAAGLAPSSDPGRHVQPAHPLDPQVSLLDLRVVAVTLAISVYGHATIVRLYLPFTVVLTRGLRRPGRLRAGPARSGLNRSSPS